MTQKSPLQILKELAQFEMSESSQVNLPKQHLKYLKITNSIVKELDDFTAFIGSSVSSGKTTTEIKQFFISTLTAEQVKERLKWLVNENFIYRVDEKRGQFMACVYYVNK